MSKSDTDVMWNAVIENNSKYDGKFYYGVKTTKIFCKPSCKSKNPNRENTLFFENSYEALAAGYRPCKRCRPDLLSSEPVQEVIDAITGILEQEYANPDLLSMLPSKVLISAFHLQRLYKKQTGYTPRAYLQKIRIDAAKALLTENNCTVADICFKVGFQSLSSFYTAFKLITGESPKEYKN